MSETITGGIAAGAVAACAAAVGIVVGLGYGVYCGLTWLSEQAQREAERLEKELAIPLPTHVTASEARRELAERFEMLKKHVSQSPLLAPQSDAIARVLALRASPLASFLTDAGLKKISAEPLDDNVFQDVLKQASQNLAFANAKHVAQSIVDVAADEGFIHQRANQVRKGKQTVVLADANGRALVADVYASEDGAKINLNLTGFGDVSCHVVMERLLNGLAKKDIRLENIHHRSHYRREGVTQSAQEYSHGSEKTRQSVVKAKEPPATVELRRRQHLISTRTKKTT